MKNKLLVLAGLIVISFSVIGCAGLGNLFSKKGKVVDIVLAEVPDTDYEPRLNPAAARHADGDVYAIPISPLALEVEDGPSPVYTISGVKDRDLEKNNPRELVDIVVNLPEKDTFSRTIFGGTDVSEWIINLPKGLEARAHGVKKGATTIKIYISGKPEVTMREVVRVQIPGEYLKSGSARQFISPTEEDSIKAWEEQQTKAGKQ
ncbi:hypothetical protein AGMMS49944_15570 [Spirochaetia bacterium]|nr:hypothetical protein AGMMS49944_15570 [Spirochaetia bacterium]